MQVYVFAKAYTRGELSCEKKMSQSMYMINSHYLWTVEVITGMSGVEQGIGYWLSLNTLTFNFL
jgi:hypothetical protein